MKLKYTTGCICTSLLVNDLELNHDYSKEGRTKITERILSNAQSKAFFDRVYDYMLESSEAIPEAEKDAMAEKFSRLEKVESMLNEVWAQMSTIADMDYFCQHVYIEYMEIEGERVSCDHCSCCGDTIEVFEKTISDE